MARLWRLVIAFVCALGAVACGNPVQDNLRESLGHEDPNVPRGPLHRPGQPCLVCHSSAGGVEPYMSVGGTVFQLNANTLPAADVLLELVDSKNRVHKVATNCAGNFYVQEQDFQPVWPMKVTLAYGNLHSYTHQTWIYREGSCAGCHTDPATATSPGHVYVTNDDTVKFGQGCP